MDWQFAQSFGTEESEDHGFCEDDIFTALDFDASGRYIALGDKAGRITVFESVDPEDDPKDKDKKKKPVFHPVEYKFHCEFQSHERGFDRLHSVEISESINTIRWWKHQTAGCSLLSTNDTTVKLWKIHPKRVRRGRRNSNITGGGNGDTGPPLAPGQIPPPIKNPKVVPVAFAKREFKNAHGTCHIDSVSQNSDGTTFISTDALKIMLWDIEVSTEAYNIVNIKPENLADLSEVITCANFHPSQCNLLAYSTSLGATRLCDLRDSALLGSHAKVFQTKKGDGFFSEVVESISDARFSPDGRHIITRDYLCTKLWDVNMDKKPLLMLPVHDYLDEYLNELHQNDCIFDKFEVAPGPIGANGLMYVTGSYDSNFVIQSASKVNETIHATSEPVKKKSQKMFSFARKSKDKKARVAKMDFAKKSLHVAWHPKLNAVAVASLNKVYIYQSP